MALAGACSPAPTLSESQQQLHGGAHVDPARPSYNVGDVVGINFSGMPGNQLDWISIATPGSYSNQFQAFQYTNGAFTGVLNFASIPAGTYEARAFFNDGTTIQATSAQFTVNGPAPATPSVSTNLLTYAPGDTITANFTNLPGGATDWISIAVAGSSDTSYVQFKYTGGGATGMVSFTGIPGGATYVARAYANDSFGAIAQSASFNVTSGGGITVTTGSPTYTTGQSVAVQFAGATLDATDWVSIAVDGSADTSYVAFQYTGGVASSTLSFGGLPAGTYRARLYFNNSFTKQAESAAFTIAQGPTTTTDAASYSAGAPITVSYSGAPGNATDWIAISVAGSPITSYAQFQYTGGGTTGTKIFNVSTAGNYVARTYSNNTYTLVSESAPFVVTAPAALTTNASTYAPMAQITINWTGLAGTARDWIGVYSVGAANNAYNAWSYTGGGTSGTLFLQAPPLPGTFEVRAFNADTYVLAATSATFTVAAPPSVTPDAFSYPPNPTIKVAFANFAGTATDWISIAIPGSPSTSYVQWFYTGGTTSGTVQFTGIAGGSYVIRGYFNDSFTIAAESSTINVGF